METTLIILFGVLFALFCFTGVWAYTQGMKLKKGKVYDTVVRKKDGTLDYAYRDDKVYEGVVVYNMETRCLIRASDGELYLLRRTGYPIGRKVMIAVRNRPSEMDEEYLKPFVVGKMELAKKSDRKATILCRLSKDILLCAEYHYEDFWDMYTENVFFVECSVKQQEKYQEKTEGPPKNCQAFMAEFERAEEFYAIPIKYRGKKFKIKACLQKSDKGLEKRGC
ncbi:MAG: hypothetical protein E7004_00345 [Alphaproteobacteria bacterium]|nr:hypothetical protein [Alphaproteobacteria bacterium]